MSLWADYQRERLGNSVLETEDGFAVYYYLGEDQVFIEEMYVVPEKRKTGVARQLADAIAVAAKARGCKYLAGAVLCGSNGATEALKVLLAYEMRLTEIRGNLIILSKKLGE